MTSQGNPFLIASLKRFSQAASATAILVGSVVLAGWMFGIPILKSLHPSLVTMKANTALAFVLAGVSLWLLLPEHAHPWRRRIAHGCAGVAVLVGGLTLSEYLFGWDVGIDQLLFKEPVGAVGTFAPGRMAPTTAFSLMTAGFALILLNVETHRGYRPAQWLTMVGGSIGSLALIGYLYGVKEFYGVASYTEMALHTSVTFILLSLGILSARPNRGLMAIVVNESLGGITARRVLPAAIGIPLLLGWLGLKGQRAGLYGTEFGVALLAVSTLIVFGVLGWRIAMALHGVDTEREQAEAGLRQSRDELEMRVQERTEELTEVNEALQIDNTQRRQTEQELARQQKIMGSLLEDLNASKQQLEEQRRALQGANKRLQDLAALKDDFVNKVSHELRTPLTSIKEGLALMVDGALGPTTAEQQDFLGTMTGDVDRLAELINNMLDISKIEAGRMRLVRTRLDVRVVIELLLRTYKPLLGHRSVRTDFAERPLVFADSNRMLQVLSNLLSNAMKFTPDDGVIAIRADQHDSRVTIAVEDNGCGIAPEDLPKLFQKFSQVGPQGADRPRGTGLGLVVCKELTELHGGRLDVTSELGRGTTFTVTLPFYTDALALSASLQELQETDRDKGEGIGLMVIQAEGLLQSQGPADEPRQQLERVAQEVKAHLHRRDVVLPIDPSWVVVLAVTEAKHLPTIAKRLQAQVPGGDRLQVGGAVSPADGSEATALFDCAKGRLGTGFGWVEQASPSGIMS